MKTPDIIIGKSGDTISGKVLNKSFNISSAFGNISVKTESIMRIHFKNLPQFNQDEIWLKNMDHLTGQLQHDVILFKLDDGTQREIPKNAIHTIIFSLDAKGMKLI